MTIREKLEAEANKLRTRLATIEDALEGLRKAEDLAAELIGERGNGDKGGPSLRAVLRELGSARGDTFTAPDLWREVRATYPDEYGGVHKASVSSAVKDLAEQGAFKLIKPGAGSRAAVYAKLDYQGGGELPLDEGSDSPKDEDAEAEG